MQSRKYGIGVTLLVLFSLILSATMAYAQQSGYEEVSVTIPAGGETSIQFDTFCLEAGKAFPAQLNAPNGRASESVLKVLKAAIEDGTVEASPLQTQLAIWHEVEGDWIYDQDQVNHDEAQLLLDRAANVSLAPIDPDGVALDQAIADGSITISSEDFAAMDVSLPTDEDDPYRGQGTLNIVNNTDQELTIYFPFGLVFESASDEEQDMVAYAAVPEQQTTPTVESTVEPTSEGLDATVEPLLTVTPEMTTTVEMTVTTTVTATVENATPTPTSDTMAADPAGPTPAAPGSLPQTGGEKSGISPVLIMLIGLILLTFSLVLVLLRKSLVYSYIEDHDSTKR